MVLVPNLFVGWFNQLLGVGQTSGLPVLAVCVWLLLDCADRSERREGKKASSPT